jgi:hypothetical protein
MHDIQRRRRRNQSEIDQLILEFQKSDLSPQEFAQNVGVQVQTVVRWLKTASVDLTHRPNHHAEHLKYSDSPSGFVAVEVRQNPSGRPISASMSCDWPEIVAPSGWKLRVPLGPEFGWVGELLAQLPQC